MALSMTACSDFLEPDSESEFVPEDATSLNELLLGEAYMRNDMKGFNIFLGLLEDDIEASPYQTPNEGFDGNLYLASYTWQPDMYEMMEEAGADALELNILSLQTSKDYTPGSFEQRHIDILRHIKKVVRIPVIMKLGSNLTTPVALINQLYANGAAAVVLFNRFYQPDIQIDNLTFTTANVMSSPSELSDRIRWTAIASAEVPQLDYAVSGGVHNGKGVIKSLLSGAAAVEVCSVIYQHGNQMIEEMKKELAEWMDDKGYDSIAQFKGKMNASAAGDINPFERTQFMKYYSNHEE